MRFTAGSTWRDPERPSGSSPTNAPRADVREKLLDAALPAVFRPNVVTFDEFAEQVLKASPTTVTRLSAPMQRILLRRIVADEARHKRLDHFGKIAATSGFLDLVSSFISELKRSETWPEHFIDACSQRAGRGHATATWA